MTGREAAKAMRRAAQMVAREAFFAALDRHGLPRPEWEVRFAPPRRWRFDYAWEAERVALEVDGGLYVGGRHSRGAGAEGDHEKLNEAAARGWRVLRTVPRKLTSPETLDAIRRSLAHAPQEEAEAQAEGAA